MIPINSLNHGLAAKRRPILRLAHIDVVAIGWLLANHMHRIDAE